MQKSKQLFCISYSSPIYSNIFHMAKQQRKGLRIRLLLRTTYFHATITTTSVTFHFLEEAISYCYYALVKQQDILMLPLSHLFFFFLLFVSAQQSNLDFSALINELWLRSRCYSRLQQKIGNRYYVLRNNILLSLIFDILSTHVVSCYTTLCMCNCICSDFVYIIISTEAGVYCFLAGSFFEKEDQGPWLWETHCSLGHKLSKNIWVRSSTVSPVS